MPDSLQHQFDLHPRDLRRQPERRFRRLDEQRRLHDRGGDYIFSYGTGSNSAITLTAVPEPGTLGLLGLALGGFFFRRLRRRRDSVVEESRES